jgi:hypothetical protein
MQGFPSLIRYHKVPNAASKVFFGGKIKSGIFACFFRVKPTVLAILAGFAGQ